MAYGVRGRCGVLAAWVGAWMLAVLLVPAGAVQAQEDEYFIPRRKPVPGAAGEGLYSKPFLYGTEGKARVGGYFDYEWRNVEGKNTTSRFHRLIPFIYANVTDRVTFATEIEFEDGADDAGGGSYVAAEFAFVDFQVNDTLTLRVGNILTPLGRLNLLHDSPLLDSTDRPLMHELVIPTTLRESGIGLVGNVAPGGGDLRIGWELYTTQGFKGGSETAPVLSPTKGFKDARPHRNVAGVKGYQDNNSNQALVGRLSVSPQVGADFGLSWHLGNWDTENRNGYAIYAVDGIWRGGPLELTGEFAAASLDRTAVAEAARVPGSMRGWYLQAGWHLYLGGLRHLGGDQDAHLTVFARLGADVIDDPFATKDNERTRTTVGLNYRPNASHTVFKFERQLNKEEGNLTETDNDAWLFSVATYF